MPQSFSQVGGGGGGGEETEYFPYKLYRYANLVPRTLPM